MSLSLARCIPLGLCWVSLVAALTTTTLTAADPETKAPPKGHAYSLFDGKTLHGWNLEHGAEVVVEEGNLLLKAGDGWLRSDHQYRDFQMHVEWKALQKEKYDAGIFIRAANDGKPFPKPSYQINMLQGHEGNLIGPGVSGKSTGLIKDGDWNTFDYTLIGDTLSMTINGQHAYTVGGLELRAGYIGFQVEVPAGGQYLIRNVQLTELDAESLFNGQDLAGWEGVGAADKASWRVADGLLECTGIEGGQWLRSAKEYGDFNLRLEYQLSAGGNSGVYVRVPADGNHHRENEQQPPAGFEVQVLDDAAEKHKDLKDYQYSASIYDIAGASPRVTRPHGVWNTLEINCHGQHITTIHNGHIVTNIHPDTHPLIQLRSVSGFLGLQNHNTVVKFRNIRVAPAYSGLK